MQQERRKTANPTCEMPRIADPEPQALGAAKAIQEAVAPDTVILFGSKARGDHRENSDTDIMVVGNSSRKSTAQLAARRYEREQEPSLNIEIHHFTEEEFERFRYSGQHVVGQAISHGVFMSDERLNYNTSYEENYPPHWPGTKEKLELTWRRHERFNREVDRNEFDQEMTGYAAQQAVENAIKALLSSDYCTVNYRHNLPVMWQHFKDQHDHMPDKEWQETVEDLMAHTSTTDTPTGEINDNWLSAYAGEIRYTSNPPILARWELEVLRDKVNDTIITIVEHVHLVSGTGDEDIFPDGKPWDPHPPQQDQ